MSISALGGIIYTNQNTPVVSHIHQLEQGKSVLQNYVAGEIANEKEKIVDEVRPTEETYKVNENKKEEKKEHKKKNKEKEKKNEKIKNEEIKDEEKSEGSIIDIRA